MRRSSRKALPPSIIVPSPWRQKLLAFVAVGLLTSGLVCARAITPAATDDFSRYHDRLFRVARVVDGDTLDIAAPDGDKDVTRIRLWGVDTPEIAHSGQPDMYFGPEASNFAKNLLTGKTVHIVLSPRKTRGKYGRLLAYVYLERGGRMFNEVLLEHGYAYADLRFPHTYKKRFEAIERNARRAGRGLWANVTLDKMPAWRRRFGKHE